jgi:hypothetical protein
MTDLDKDSWDEWRIYVVRSLDVNTSEVKAIRQDLADIKAAAKTWGAITSLIVSPIIVGLVLAVISAFK